MRKGNNALKFIIIIEMMHFTRPQRLHQRQPQPLHRHRQLAKHQKNHIDDLIRDGLCDEEDHNMNIITMTMIMMLIMSRSV